MNLIEKISEEAMQKQMALEDEALRYLLNRNGLTKENYLEKGFTITSNINNGNRETISLCKVVDEVPVQQVKIKIVEDNE